MNDEQDSMTWAGEELVRIVIAVRASQKQEGQPLWNLAVNQTCDEFASKLLAFLGTVREKQAAQIQKLHFDYSVGDWSE